jgi:polyphosphate kinase 2 (PPK2 family)
MKEKYRSLLPESEQKKAKSYFKDGDEYDAELLKAQKAMVFLQQEIHRSRRKVLIILEGQDTAGKGGLIRRMAQYLDPRGLKVHSIGKPNVAEAEQHYMQRFFSILPAPGEIAVFDRSWYGRVLVERVEKFAKKEEWKRAYGEINSVEKMLTDDGIAVLKYFLDLSHKEQGKRFKEREKNPLKSWKMTPDDYRNRKKWKEYSAAFRDMIERTSPENAPWMIVPADSEWFSRVTILRDIVENLKR